MIVYMYRDSRHTGSIERNATKYEERVYEMCVNIVKQELDTNPNADVDLAFRIAENVFSLLNPDLNSYMSFYIPAHILLCGEW